MAMEDDFQLSSHLEQSSSPVHARRLKRLKKASVVSSDDVVAKPVNGQVLGSLEVLESDEEPLGFDVVKELDSGFAEEGSRSERGNGADQGGEKGEGVGDPTVDDFDSEGPNQESLRFNFGSELNHGFDEDRPSSTKRVLDFGGDGEDPSGEKREQTGDLSMSKSERKRDNSKDLAQKKVKRKKRLESVADDGKPDPYASEKRMTKKVLYGIVIMNCSGILFSIC